MNIIVMIFQGVFVRGGPDVALSEHVNFHFMGHKDSDSDVKFPFIIQERSLDIFLHNSLTIGLFGFQKTLNMQIE